MCVIVLCPVLIPHNTVSTITDGQTALGYVTANEPVTWSISNSATFSISSGGVVTLRSPSNYQSIRSYTYSITAADNASNTTTFTKTVYVTDSTPPTITSTNLVNTINDRQTALGYVTANDQ